jgi:hypothetical protein
MFGNSCPEGVKIAVRASLQVQEEAFEDKYLGLPTPEGRMHRDRFQNLQGRLTKRILQWDDGLLSQAAKEILIKAVGQSIPTYLMSVFKLPFSVCDDLTRMIRNYWWGSKKGKRKTHWKAWEQLTKPKSFGGLGFRDFRLFNQAMLARQAWRLLTQPESLCARVLKAKYYPRGHLQDTVFPRGASSSWQAIQHGLELLKKGLIWRVGNGQSIRVWRDQWIPRPHSFRPISKQRRCRIRRVSGLLTPEGSWDMQTLRRYFLQVDIDEIVKLRPSPRLHDDILAWAPENSGVFSVRSAYWLAWEFTYRRSFGAASRAPDGTRAIWKAVWRCPAPPKVRTFAWRVATNSLATWENKQKRNMEITDICVICGVERETTFHTFCRCPSAVAL